MDTGPLIAISVVSLYTLLGPLVLLGIHAVFDSFAQTDDTPPPVAPPSPKKDDENDPAVWTAEDIESFLEQKHL